jgi:hypothetical protein
VSLRRSVSKVAGTVSFAGSILAALMTFGGTCFAAERGLSSYLPGYYGDYGVAVAPAPGFYIYGTYYGYQAHQKISGFDGGLKLSVSALISGFQYVMPEKISGFTFAVGAYTAWIDADLKGALKGSQGSLLIAQHKSEHGDTSISPVIIYWSSGNFHLNAYETIFIPTGDFKTADSLNLSRNYFSFDNVVSMTWLDPKRGLELSVAPGLLVNTENKSTRYKTGTEFHLDAMANLFLSPTCALGLHGYLYTQMEDDELNGVVLKNQRSSSMAVGPSLLWVSSEPGIEGKVVLKWLHDIDADNRFRGDIFSLTGAVKF